MLGLREHSRQRVAHTKALWQEAAEVIIQGSAQSRGGDGGVWEAATGHLHMQEGNLETWSQMMACPSGHLNFSLAFGASENNLEG